MVQLRYSNHQGYTLPANFQNFDLNTDFIKLFAEDGFQLVQSGALNLFKSSVFKTEDIKQLITNHPDDALIVSLGYLQKQENGAQVNIPSVIIHPADAVATSNPGNPDLEAVILASDWINPSFEEITTDLFREFELEIIKVKNRYQFSPPSKFYNNEIPPENSFNEWRNKFELDECIRAYQDLRFYPDDPGQEEPIKSLHLTIKARDWKTYLEPINHLEWTELALIPIVLESKYLPGVEVEPIWAPEGNYLTFMLVPARTSSGANQLEITGFSGSGKKLLVAGDAYPPEWIWRNNNAETDIQTLPITDF